MSDKNTRKRLNHERDTGNIDSFKEPPSQRAKLNPLVYSPNAKKDETYHVFDCETITSINGSHVEANNVQLDDNPKFKIIKDKENEIDALYDAINRSTHLIDKR